MTRPMMPAEIKEAWNTKTGIRVNNTRLGRRKGRLTRRQIFLIAIMLLISMGGGIGYVWSNFEGTQIGYNMSLLRQEELKLKELNLKLRLELETLKSPQNLEDATRRLGLRHPLPEQIIILP